MYALVDRPVGHLTNSGRFLLWAMRAWADASASGKCRPITLCRGFSAVNARAALPDFHMAMTLLRQSGRLPFELAAIPFPIIAEDEAVLLGMWRRLGLGDIENVRATLVLIASEAIVPTISKAMTKAAAGLVRVGFDLSELSPAILKENK